MDPLPEKEGSIFLPNKGRVRTATVLRVGPGRPVGSRRVPVGVERGERVAFYREHLEHQQGKQIVAALRELGEDLGLIRGPDILFAFPMHEEVRVS